VLEDEVALRFIYYRFEEECHNPHGQMWFPSFMFSAHGGFFKCLRNPAKAAKVRFTFSLQFTFLPN
jgi:hypothetical protein